MPGFCLRNIHRNKTTKLIAVIAFPFGAIPYEIKKSQAEWAAEMGADELDIVPNFLHTSEHGCNTLNF